MYPRFDVHVGLIKAAAADERGNLYMDRQVYDHGSIDVAMAARASRGVVIAEVDRMISAWRPAGPSRAHSGRHGGRRRPIRRGALGGRAGAGAAWAHTGRAAAALDRPTASRRHRRDRGRHAAGRRRGQSRRRHPHVRRPGGRPPRGPGRHLLHRRAGSDGRLAAGRRRVPQPGSDSRPARGVRLLRRRRAGRERPRRSGRSTPSATSTSAGSPT